MLNYVLSHEKFRTKGENSIMINYEPHEEIRYT